MAVRLAESLFDCGDFKPSDIPGRYLAWWQEGAFDTGPVSGRALALVGAVAGARRGASAIPPSTPAHVDILPRVREAAEALAAAWTA